jgi:transposase
MAGMDANKLFEMALGVGNGWRVVKSEMNVPGRQLRLWLDFAAGSQFACPKCGEWCGVHDTTEKSWRHLNFWQHQTELHGRCPRVKCEEHGVLQAEVPWARAGSGFTLMMEAMIVLMCQQMPVAEVARMLGVHDTQLWRVLTYHVELAQAGRDWSGVKRILVDETSAKRGHRYVTNFVDAEKRELLFMVEGRKAEAFAAFAEALRAHGGDPERIELIAMDMSPAYRAGAEEFFPKARVVFDHFHLMQMAGQALDEVRKSLRRAGADLAGGLWSLRGNVWTRTEEQQQTREALCQQYPKLGRAMMLRETLQDVLGEEDEEGLRWWCRRAMRSQLEPFRKLARTIRAHPRTRWSKVWRNVTQQTDPPPHPRRRHLPQPRKLPAPSLSHPHGNLRSLGNLQSLPQPTTAQIILNHYNQSHHPNELLQKTCCLTVGILNKS